MPGLQDHSRAYPNPLQELLGLLQSDAFNDHSRDRDHQPAEFRPVVRSLEPSVSPSHARRGKRCLCMALTTTVFCAGRARPRMQLLLLLT